MLDKELELTLNNAFREAREQRHEFMTVEHLLLALLDNASAAKVLRACGANLNALHTDLIRFIQEIGRMRLSLCKDSNKHIGTRDFFIA